MINMKKLFLIICISLFSISSNAQFAEIQAKLKTNRNNKVETTFSQLSKIQVNGCTYIYKGNAMFSGTAWSNDKKSAELRCEEGQIHETTIYHRNGKVAMTNSIAIYGDYYNDIYFDEYGNKIDRNDFKQRYKYLWNKASVLEKEIRNR